MSTPITWEEVRACRRPDQLIYTSDDVLDRFTDLGDLFAVVDANRATLPDL